MSKLTKFFSKFWHSPTVEDLRHQAEDQAQAALADWLRSEAAFKLWPWWQAELPQLRAYATVAGTTAQQALDRLDADMKKLCGQ